MKPHWIVEENKFASTDFDALIAAIKAQGNTYSLVTIRPFVHDIVGKIPKVPDGAPVICYGSLGIHKVANDYGWKPGTFYSPEMTPENYNKHLGSMMLNHDTRIVPMDKVLDEVTDYEFFIRPNTDNKEFAGMVIKRDDFKEWLDKLMAIGYLENTNFDVAISSVKEIYKEFRLIVINGEVVTGSLYRFSGHVKKKRDYPEMIEEMAIKAIREFNPALAYVVDVAWMYDRDEPYQNIFDEYRIIEYNTFNSAGFYDSDIEKIVHGFNKYYERN